MKKKALITGITGQDGSYLAEFLLSKNYIVYGFGRRESLTKRGTNMDACRDNIELVFGDLSDSSSVHQAIQIAMPDEVYNLASQSRPGESWNLTLETADITALGTNRIFDAVRQIKADTKIYQASSSEMYGNVTESPQNENTPFNPMNPYAAAKLYAHNLAKIYRQSYNLFISCGILFNHESPRRGLHFITQKICYAAASIKLGIVNSEALNEQGDPIVKNGKLLLGNLNAARDWGYAPDYVEAMWLMLQQPVADDFVIGTGKSTTIRELCDIAFSYVGLDWQQYIESDPRFMRPSETKNTIANASKAADILGWQPKTNLAALIASMIDEHLARYSRLSERHSVQATSIVTQA